MPLSSFSISPGSSRKRLCPFKNVIGYRIQNQALSYSAPLIRFESNTCSCANILKACLFHLDEAFPNILYGTKSGLVVWDALRISIVEEH